MRLKLQRCFVSIISEKCHLLNIKQHWHNYILPISCTIYAFSCIYLFTDNPAVRDIIIKITAYTIIFSSMSLLTTAKYITHPAITCIDKYSMGIYLIHHILIQYSLSLHPIFLFLATHYIIGPILIFTASTICSIYMASLLHKTPYLQKVI